MELTPEKWDRVKNLFEAVVAQSPEIRSSYLLANCPDLDIRAEVERLLGSHENLNHFLSGPALSYKSPVFPSRNYRCEAGTVLADRFRVVQYLAQGGMGEVYEAEDLELQERVALKLIRHEVLQNRVDALNRFKREVRLAKQVSHPNICRVFDLFRHSGGRGTSGEDLIFVSMELLLGETLSDRLKHIGRMATDEALPLCLQMASALQAAHDRNILHRDFKPGNVFLVSGSQPQKLRVVVTDFGLALGLGDNSVTLTPSTARSFLGTPAYMSPEQLEGRELGPASDVYSLGLVMYQMLVGKLPFEDETPIVMGMRRLCEPIPSPRIETPDLERRWEAVILQCLERDPSRRFRSASDVAQALVNERQPVKRRAGVRKKLKSLAILPFVNVGGAGDTEYLSDGITESLIIILSRLPKLRIMARSTVFRYKRPDADPQVVGRQLSVNSVLTGRVAQHGKTLVVTTELVDVSNGWQLWGGKYNRNMDDIFAVQEEIAHEISSTLELKLASQDRQRIAQPSTRNTDAYKLYLKGRYCLNKRSESQIRAAMQYFTEAIKMDSKYAPSYVGLADCYATLSFVFSERPRETMPRAKVAVLESLRLDQDLSEANASLGMIISRYEWNFELAEKKFQRAIELSPGNATAKQWYGEALAGLNRMQEAIGMLKEAQDIDPLSPIVNAILSGMYYFARRYDDAIEQGNKALELEPNFWPALLFCGLSYGQIGEFSKALQLVEGTLTGQIGPALLAAAVCVNRDAGRHTEAAATFMKLTELSRACYVAPIHLALAALGIGDEELALTELERAVEERSGWLVFLNVDPRFDDIRSNSRFQRVVGRMESHGVSDMS
jgi:serine/threonine-protein kinase